MASTISFDSGNSWFQLGINNGSLTANFHPQPERPETPPSPLSNVPFPRDPDFIDRGTLLDQIDEKCSTRPSKIALVGIGGVGKSQLVVEYSHRIREKSTETWVLWVYAGNMARFEQSFRDIAERVKIPGRKQHDANVFILVRDWLQDNRKSWVLILDNLDDDSFLHEVPPINQVAAGQPLVSQPLVAYLPRSIRGSIIVTTRRKAVALRMVDSYGIIDVEHMKEADALVLFDKKLDVQDDPKDIGELAKALEHMPLAIVQAAAYINQQAPRFSVKRYLDEFQRSDRKKLRLLEYEGPQGQLRRDWEAKNSIILTWQISFDRIRQERPSAADLLSLMSFFDRQGIHECLLRNSDTSGNENPSQAECHDDDNSETSTVGSNVDYSFEDDVAALRDYQLIKVKMDAVSFEMHRLVQLATQKWVKAQRQYEKWKDEFIRNLAREYPSTIIEAWEKCRLLFPHVQSAMVQKPRQQPILKDWIFLLSNAARFAMCKGAVVEAEQMALKSMEVAGRLLGPESLYTLHSKQTVGAVLENRGKYKEAEAMFRQLVAYRRKQLGDKHHDAVSLKYLALVLMKQGKYNEAKAMYQQELADIKSELGADHPDTLNVAGGLGLLLGMEGRYEEAEAMHRQVLAGTENKLGMGHPETLKTVGFPVSELEEQGRYKETEDLCQLAMASKSLASVIPILSLLGSCSILGRE